MEVHEDLHSDHDALQCKFTELARAAEHAPHGALRKLAQILEKDDHVGLSFWLVTGLMLASTVFFFFQVFLVPKRWANSMIVCGLVTGVAWHHYLYMKDIWAETKRAPTIYRYMDWLITVPLQVVEFYLVLSAASPVDKPLASAMFFRLMFASILMLVLGYMGETGVMERWVAFCGGMFMWIFIIYEVYLGEASRTSGRLSLDEAKKFLARVSKDEGDDDSSSDEEIYKPETTPTKNSMKKKEAQAVSSIVPSSPRKETNTNSNGVVNGVNNNDDADAIGALQVREFRKPEAQLAFELLRFIVLFGWALYPIGYVLGGVENSQAAEDALNGVYNVADLVNKVAFGAAIFYAAGSQNEIEKQLIVTSRIPTIETLLARKGGTLDLVSRALQDKLAQARVRAGSSKGTRSSGANTGGSATPNDSKLTTGAQSPREVLANTQGMMGTPPTLLQASGMINASGGVNMSVNMSSPQEFHMERARTPPILKNSTSNPNIVGQFGTPLPNQPQFGTPSNVNQTLPAQMFQQGMSMAQMAQSLNNNVIQNQSMPPQYGQQGQVIQGQMQQGAPISGSVTPQVGMAAMSPNLGSRPVTPSGPQMPQQQYQQQGQQYQAEPQFGTSDRLMGSQ